MKAMLGVTLGLNGTAVFPLMNVSSSVVSLLSLWWKYNNICPSLKGEEHYNCISALHKSMRGSDENASLYWLGRMLEGGEDPIYVARRMVRFASEDVGKWKDGSVTTSQIRTKVLMRSQRPVVFRCLQVWLIPPPSLRPCPPSRPATSSACLSAR